MQREGSQSVFPADPRELNCEVVVIGKTMSALVYTGGGVLDKRGAIQKSEAAWRVKETQYRN